MCDSTLLAPLSSARFNRRVALKASAAFSAMAAAGGIVRPQPARASAITTSQLWVEVEHPEVAHDPDSGYRTFPIDMPVSAVAPIWDADTEPGIVIELAVSYDGETWSPTMVVGEAVHDAGPADRAGRRFGDLVFAEGAVAIQYRAFGNAGPIDSVPGLAFTLIDSSVGPTISDVVAAAIGGEVWSPPVISRAAWGADETFRFDADDNVYWPLEYQTVEHVIIHHTETLSFQNPVAAVRAIYYYHAVERGWGDIGYNYLVDHMGNVYEGRWGGEDVVGGHAYEYARGSSGIGVLGSFSYEETTPEAQAGIVWITAWAGRNLDPFGAADFHEVEDCPTICAHRDVNPTACPGDGLYGQLDRIRSLVAEVLAGADPAPEPEFFVGDTVQTVVEGANLRSGPGSDWEVRAAVPYGAVFTITEGASSTGGETWYGVDGDWGWGWMAGPMLGLLAVATVTEDGFAVGDEVVVATDMLNIRSEPNQSGYVVASMPTSAVATIVGGPVRADGYQWHQIESDYGAGWVVGTYLALRGDGTVFVAGDEAYVDTDELALRAGPGSTYRRIAVVPGGETVTILSGPVRADAREWYEVRTDRSGDGWVAATWLVAA
jgi:uncharacterized protein YgiM (DUF1202 family)